MNEIINQLWITNISGVRERDTSEFDRVITTCQDEVSDNVGCEYDYFDMADGPHSKDFYGGDDSYGIFEEAADTAHQALVDGETILVHCHAGQNRSVSVSAAALARYKDLSYTEALNLIKEHRPIADPTETYHSHIQRYIEEH